MIFIQLNSLINYHANTFTALLYIFILLYCELVHHDAYIKARIYYWSTPAGHSIDATFTFDSEIRTKYLDSRIFLSLSLSLKIISSNGFSHVHDQFISFLFGSIRFSLSSFWVLLKMVEERKKLALNRAFAHATNHKHTDTDYARF